MGCAQRGHQAPSIQEGSGGLQAEGQGTARRDVGKSMAEVVEKLKLYVNGWKAYSKLADTPKVWRGLDEWMRHRLRAIQLKQWRGGRTINRELRKLGASEDVAKRVAGNSRCWWRNSGKHLNMVLTIAYFDRLGAPRLV
jgi:RNA-directed DNA polymerase